MRDSVIGEHTAIDGPFGKRPLVYADYVASGRGLSFIESAMRQHVLHNYANTHTETSFTGRETTRLRELARESIRESVGADARHAVIFCGAGATAAIDKLIRAMGLGKRSPQRAQAAPVNTATPVVFVGPYEHHSNDLPWRESNALIVRIPLDDYDQICLVTLAQKLQHYAAHPQKIGTFSAASNVTGIKTDLRAIAKILHQYDALFVCDFAAAAPYVNIAIKASGPGAADHIDAIVISAHKFIGGPGASGVLVADRSIFTNPVPTVAGGGTVRYVNADQHVYSDNIERREEAGTPAILGDIRAGMVMQLKSDIGEQCIEQLEKDIIERVKTAWVGHPNVRLLGSLSADRLAIFSFNIDAGHKALHYGFVVALLNDLFGIQARGGCSCAGPYGHHLLSISSRQAHQFKAFSAQGLAIYSPGWVRLSFNYFFSKETVDYIVEAVQFIAQYGVRFLSRYRVNPETGVWQAKDSDNQAPNKLARLSDAWLQDWPTPPGKTLTAADLSSCLQQALALARQMPACDAVAQPSNRDSERLRWFWLPEEAHRACASTENLS